MKSKNKTQKGPGICTCAAPLNIRVADFCERCHRPIEPPTDQGIYPRAKDAAFDKENFRRHYRKTLKRMINNKCPPYKMTIGFKKAFIDRLARAVQGMADVAQKNPEIMDQINREHPSIKNKRRCRFPGCTTTPSHYNSAKHCHLHEKILSQNNVLYLRGKYCVLTTTNKTKPITRKEVRRMKERIEWA